MTEAPETHNRVTSLPNARERSAARDAEILEAARGVLSRGRSKEPMPANVLGERVAAVVNTPARETPDAFAHRLVKILPQLPSEKVCPARPRKETLVQPPPEVFEAEGHSMAPLFLDEREADLENLRTYVGPAADVVDRAVEISKQIGQWERVAGNGPGILERFEKARRKDVERNVAETQVHQKNGAKGGAVANLTGNEKAKHLAKSIRKKNPMLSDRGVARKIKEEGCSSVSNDVESLRKSVAAWAKSGEIPAKENA